jgi:hypothetical protein
VPTKARKQWEKKVGHGGRLYVFPVVEPCRLTRLRSNATSSSHVRHCPGPAERGFWGPGHCYASERFSSPSLGIYESLRDVCACLIECRQRGRKMAQRCSRDRNKPCSSSITNELGECTFCIFHLTGIYVCPWISIKHAIVSKLVPPG